MDIKSENINKTYVKKGLFNIEILNSINIEILSGQKIALTGPSGAGKSTLIHILGLMDRPTSGKVYIDGIDCFKNNDKYLCAMRKNNIGFIFQFHYLMLDFSVLENILLPVWSERYIRLKYAKSILERLGILDRQDHFPNELSGGEQQRVALARALINDPRIIFADEPTGNLDRVTGLEIERLLFEISSESGSTLVLVTHNEELVSRADRVIKIVNGKVCT
ncbi:MAG: ABC transporter ATP-binding protein [Endomicrobium sp.]|jgi:lipoprotein-releasing system ATP-binding protein|nr:ABC transporter ATP-binding protein [Endomicrobium sp.]